MKRLVILGIIATFFAISCSQPTHKAINKTDSVFVLVRYPGGNGYLLDTGVRQIVAKEVLDTETHKGKWISDTSVFVKQNVDTLRDSLRRPIFDSLHHVRYRRQYFPVPDSLYQIVRIKHTPFN